MCGDTRTIFLKEVYHEYRTEFELNRYLDYQFMKWAKKYNLDAKVLET